MTKTILLLCLALLPGTLLTSLPARAQTVAQAPAAASPEAEFFKVANAAAALLKRVMAQPPSGAAQAAVQRECDALYHRGKLVTPAYSRWLRALPKAEVRPAVQRLQATPFVQYFSKLQSDPKLEAQYRDNPVAADIVLKMMNALDLERI